MKILLLFNSDRINVDKVENCQSRRDLFILMIKTHFKRDNIEFVIDKCSPCTEMKSTFKLKTINNFKKVDHIIFVDDTGLYKKEQTFINHLKTCATTISTLCKHSKFYNGEDNLFTYDIVSLNNNVHYINPPLDDLLYAPKKENKILYILLDKKPNQFILNQINNLILANENKNDIVFKIGIINTKHVKIIKIHNDIDNNKVYEVIEEIWFNSYVDYIHELSKALVYICLSKVDDIYLLYELAMCNTLHVSKNGFVKNKIIRELDLCTYDDEEINWREIFEKLKTYNTRQILIDRDCSWTNAMNTIVSRLEQYQLTENKDIKQLSPVKKGYCLNIVNKNRPIVIDLAKVRENNAKNKNTTKSIVKKKKVLLQSELRKKT
jgi:hypothetical protein